LTFSAIEKIFEAREILFCFLWKSSFLKKTNFFISELEKMEDMKLLTDNNRKNFIIKIYNIIQLGGKT